MFARQSDFYATDAGRAHFADQLKSIRLRSTTRTLRPTSAPQPASYPRPLAFAGTASRRWAPHRMPPNPRPARAPNPHPTTTPARAQTCNFDVLYAVRGRVLNPSPLAILLGPMPTLTCRLRCSCAVPHLRQCAGRLHTTQLPNRTLALVGADNPCLLVQTTTSTTTAPRTFAPSATSAPR